MCVDGSWRGVTVRKFGTDEYVVLEQCTTCGSYRGQVLDLDSVPVVNADSTESEPTSEPVARSPDQWSDDDRV